MPAMTTSLSQPVARWPGSREQVGVARSIGHETARFDVVATAVRRRQSGGERKGMDANPVVDGERFGLRRLAIMANVGNPGAVLEMDEAQAAARTLGLDVVPMEIRQRAEDIAPAFDMLKGRAEALYVVSRGQARARARAACPQRQPAGSTGR
jgi:diacylglycerol kinase family enzyme